jgi:quercetin dioxygenase-like cupin family protein
MTTTRSALALAALAWAMIVRPAALVGQDAPPVGQFGVQVLAGNPDQAGHFVLRITFPPGGHTDPHHHRTDLIVKVRSGKMMLGFGSLFDTTSVVAYQAGSTTFEPATKDHFEWFPDGGVVEYEGEGPLDSVVLDANGKPVSPP